MSKPDALTKIKVQVDKLSLYGKQLDVAQSNAERSVSVPFKLLVQEANYVLGRMRPTIVADMMANYTRSGLGTFSEKTKYKHSEWLKNLVSASELQLLIDSSGGIGGFQIILPRQYGTGGQKIHADKVYEIAGALNFGCVQAGTTQQTVRDTVTKKIIATRSVSPFGEKAKRTIKQYAYTGLISKKQREALGPKFNFYRDESANGKSVQVGQFIRVHKPHPYYYLTQVQRERHMRTFALRLAERIDALVSKGLLGAS